MQVDRDTFQKVVEMQEQPASLVAEINEVARVGVGSFIKDDRLDNDFKEPPISKAATRLNRPDPANDSDNTVWGIRRVNGEEERIGFDPKDVASVGRDQSWGVITKDDARVPISIR